jgi:hypothetical protein
MSRTPDRGLSQLAGTADAELRREIFRYALQNTDPTRHENIRRLYSNWEAWNLRFFRSALVPAVILLNGPESTLCYGDCSTESGFGCGSQIRIRPSILEGTLEHLRGGNRDPEGLMRFAEDVLLHEMIHQLVFEQGLNPDRSYNGHGPVFSSIANDIGEQLGLPPVRRTNKSRDGDEPSPSQWPHNVRQLDYYLGAYVPASRDEDAILRRHLSVVLRRHGIEKVRRTTDEVWKKIEEAREAKRRLAGSTAKVINLKDKPRPDPDTYVYIARRQWCGKELFTASPWANYFSVNRYGRYGAIKRYVEKKLLGKPFLIEEELPRLAHEVLVEGKMLACWCAPNGPLSKDDPLYCHGQVLLRLLYSDEPHRDMLVRLVEELG